MTRFEEKKEVMTVSRKLGVSILLLLSIGATAQQLYPILPLTKEALKERRDQITQDNEFDRNEKGLHTNIHENCLLLHGVPFDVGYLATTSFGMMSLVRGKPGTPEQEPILFKAYVRRNGMILCNPFFQNPVYEVSISTVLAVARPGDMLIVEPFFEEDYKAKRVLKLID